MKPIRAALVVGVLLTAAVAHAQGPLSGACQTQFGICPAPVAPVGAPCMCGPGHPGRMIYQGGPAPVPMGAACATRFGVCPMPYPAPIGTPCGCGRDPGQIIR